MFFKSIANTKTIILFLLVMLCCYLAFCFFVEPTDINLELTKEVEHKLNVTPILHSAEKNGTSVQKSESVGKQTIKSNMNNTHSQVSQAHEVGSESEISTHFDDAVIQAERLEVIFETEVFHGVQPLPSFNSDIAEHGTFFKANLSDLKASAKGARIHLDLLDQSFEAVVAQSAPSINSGYTVSLRLYPESSIINTTINYGDNGIINGVMYTQKGTFIFKYQTGVGGYIINRQAYLNAAGKTNLAH